MLIEGRLRAIATHTSTCVHRYTEIDTHTHIAPLPSSIRTAVCNVGENLVFKVTTPLGSHPGSAIYWLCGGSCPSLHLSFLICKICIVITCLLAGVEGDAKRRSEQMLPRAAAPAPRGTQEISLILSLATRWVCVLPKGGSELALLP